MTGAGSGLRRGLYLAALCAALFAAVAACGKRGDLKAPKGEEAAYTWPQAYPNPATVRPEKNAGNGQVPSREQAPTHATDITPFPDSP